MDAQITAAIIGGCITLVTFFLANLYDRKKNREAHHREYLQTKAKPFLMALNTVLNEIYRFTFFPPYYRELFSVFPEIAVHAKGDEKKLIDAMVEMSSQRIELLLCIKQSKIVYTANLFADFITNLNELYQLRSEVWSNPQKYNLLINKQNKCSDIGRDLLIEITDSLLSFNIDKEYSAQMLNKLSNDLREPLQKSSALIATFASSSQNHFWIGIWEEVSAGQSCDDLLNYFKSIYNNITQTGVSITGRFLDSNQQNAVFYNCFYIIKFPSKSNQENFMNNELPQLKMKNPVYWFNDMKPMEINDL